MASLSDILSTLQNGVVAINNFGLQMKGTLNNILSRFNIITTNVATNTANIATNTTNIATNTANIATNTTNIATNTANIIDKVTKNYIVNSAMMVSQENGTTAVTTFQSFPVDQFYMEFSNTGTQTAQQVASATAGGSTSRVRVTATVADAAVAAGDYSMVVQPIEGLRAADLLLGAASAKTITIQFGVKAPAGTYSIALRNAALNRGYAAEYVISVGEANTDVVKSVTIALDQTGAWLTTNGIGLYVIWNLMCGTTFSTAPNVWTAANIIASTNQFNFMGTINNVFELFDVSLTVGATAPAFQLPDYPEALRACQRYFYMGEPPLRGACNGAALAGRAGCIHPVPMRTAPTLTLTAALGVYDGAGTSTLTPITTNYSTTSVLEFDGTISVAGTAGRPAIIYQGVGGNLKVNARM